MQQATLASIFVSCQPTPSRLLTKWRVSSDMAASFDRPMCENAMQCYIFDSFAIAASIYSIDLCLQLGHGDILCSGTLSCLLASLPGGAYHPLSDRLHQALLGIVRSLLIGLAIGI